MSAPALARSSLAYRKAVEELRDNPGQWQAYQSESHCVVLAGPGSGKTKTLTIKIAQLLIDTIREPRGLACITYNAECARELRIRLDRFGVSESEHIFIGTLHAFCLTRVLMPYATLAGIPLPESLRVALQSEQEILLARALAAEIRANERPSEWRTRMEEYRRTHVDRDRPEWLEDAELAALVSRYEELLEQEGLIDFDQMVLKALAMIESHAWVRRALHAKYPVIVVDEYQDLGVPLHRIVTSLCFRGGSRLFAVGDPDQSIYGFTGARPQLLRALAQSPAVEMVRLPFNYRSGPTIIKASEIALGEPRGYESRSTTRGTVDFHERPAGLDDQARFICTELIPNVLERIDGLQLGHIAVLYLDKYDGDVIARAAADQGFRTMRIDRGGPYPKTPLTRWLEDCAAWCAGGWRSGAPRLSAILATWMSIAKIRPSDVARMRAQRTAVVRFLATHRDGDLLVSTWLERFRACCLDEVIGDDSTLRDEQDALATIATACGPEGTIADWTVSALGGQGGAPDHLNLITLHSAKGLEFRVVIMMGMDQGRIPSWNAGPREKRERRRLFYVGLTRAKEEVHLTYSGWTQNRYGRRFFNGPSEFLTEVRDRLLEGNT